MPFIEHNGIRVLFIHISKAGGTTVEQWMRSIAPVHLYCDGIPQFTKCTPQHYRLRDVRELFRDGYFDYTFALVRNPYDRIASEYRMRAALAQETFFGTFPSFSMWLEESLQAQRHDPFYLDNHIRPQWEFLGSDVGIFRLEHGIAPALAQVAARLGVAAPEQMPITLSTTEKGIEVKWDHSDRIAVQEHYQRDFTEFGYPVD